MIINPTGVKSVQYVLGTSAAGGGNATVTIAAVNVSKTVLIPLTNGSPSTASTYYYTLTDSTTITITSSGATSQMQCRFCVVEYF